MNFQVKTTIAISMLLFQICICFAQPADDPQSPSVPRFSEVEFEVDEMLPLLLGGQGETDAALWDWLQDGYQTTHFRMRVLALTNNLHPAHYVRTRVNRESVSAGAIVVRDANEPDAFDHWRVGLDLNREEFTAVIGDFRIDQALGWTVSSSPSWSSSIDALSPLRRPSESIRLNLSSEEGYGWRGLAVTYDPQSFPIPVSLDFWGGTAAYDGRYDNNDLLIPYATQGDHTAQRLITATVSSLHAGTHLNAHIPANAGALSLTAAATRFTEPLSPETSNARFRFADQNFNALGLGWKWNGKESSQTMRAEITRQSTDAWGGAVIASGRFHKSARIIGHFWRATQSFSTLHARPSLGFGSDPAGNTGTQLSMQLARSNSVLSLGVTANWKEAEHIQASSDQRQSMFIRVQLQPTPIFDFDASARLHHEQPVTGLATDDLATRIWLRMHRETRSISARMDANHNRSGMGAGLTLSMDDRVSKLLRLHLAISGVIQNGNGATINLIELAGPGVFPIVRTSSEQVRVMIRADYSPFDTVNLWGSMRAVRNLELNHTDSPSLDTIISVGLDWYDFFR